MTEQPREPAPDVPAPAPETPRRRLALHWQILIGLVVGAAAGLVAQALFAPKPHGIENAVISDGSVASVDAATGRLVVREKAAGKEVETAIEAKNLKLFDTAGDPTTLAAFPVGARVEMIRQAGQVVGIRLKDTRLEWIVTNITQPIGQVFLRLIFMVVIPLVFSALVLGVAGIGDMRRLGSMGLRTLVFTVLLSSMSVVIGLTLVNVIRPGERLSAEKRQELQDQYAKRDEAAKVIAQAKQAKPLRELLLDIIPRNPLQEMVGALDGSSPGGGMLAVMFFALMFGIAVTLTPQRTGTLVAVLEGVFDVTMVIIGIAMRLAPIGVAALVFSLTAVIGFDILTTLAWYVVTVILGLALHLFGVYSLVVGLIARMNPLTFFRKISDAMLTAFATSSSNATLPTALRVAEQNLHLRPETSRFVLTIGSTANQNGTALYEGITVLFLAQLLRETPLTFTEQLTVVFGSILAGIGTAGIPGGSLPLVAMLLLAVGVPEAGIGIILGVDRLLDMCRTTVNVTGDIAVAACVDRAEARSPEAPG